MKTVIVLALLSLFAGVFAQQCKNSIFRKEDFKALRLHAPQLLKEAEDQKTPYFCVASVGTKTCCSETSRKQLETAYQTYAKNLETKFNRIIDEAITSCGHLDKKKVKSLEKRRVAALKNLSISSENCRTGILKHTRALLCKGCDPTIGEFSKKGSFRVDASDIAELVESCGAFRKDTIRFAKMIAKHTLRDENGDGDDDNEEEDNRREEGDNETEEEAGRKRLLTQVTEKKKTSSTNNLKLHKKARLFSKKNPGLRAAAEPEGDGEEEEEDEDEASRRLVKKDGEDDDEDDARRTNSKWVKLFSSFRWPTLPKKDGDDDEDDARRKKDGDDDEDDARRKVDARRKKDDDDDEDDARRKKDDDDDEVDARRKKDDDDDEDDARRKKDGDDDEETVDRVRAGASSLFFNFDALFAKKVRKSNAIQFVQKEGARLSVTSNTAANPWNNGTAMAVAVPMVAIAGFFLLN
eukprot:TRINITY_DN322_c0_g1_i12.p1 TRINITY_DN322_c0_g1~~TRINITY_DN322_c0_g1_i12.p1  ORF type:complete len:466 (-),score=190.20 TRINITY_DN322_c0_g1_i12:100-1497(-)